MTEGRMFFFARYELTSPGSSTCRGPAPCQTVSPGTEQRSGSTHPSKLTALPTNLDNCEGKTVTASPP